ncbi:MAG TPA: hypothetical protein VG756_10510 [Pseudonocardiaceae bacterium]|jgi:hypothetical protein|nr:hypothetical protein [Pseudonocardiaceae bacterium]
MRGLSKRVVALLVVVVPAWVGLGSVAAAAPSGNAGGPVVASVRPDLTLDQQWRSFGDASGHAGWAGADGTYSTPLPGGLDAWLYNDTFLGPVNADESLPRTSTFIHNSLVLSTPQGQPLVTVTGGTTSQPQSLVGSTPNPPTPGGTDANWYWNTDGIVDAGKLYIFETEIAPTDTPPPFDFGQIDMKIAELSLPDLRVQRVVPTYGGATMSWGVQLLREGPWIYIYGVESGYLDKYLHVARAHVGQLDGAWQFYTGSGWSNDPADSARVADNVGASFSVTKVDGRYVLATTDSTLDPQIYLETATSPVGPFTDRTMIYNPPGAGGDIYAYNVAAHPEISGPNRLVLSYNTNASTLDDLYQNINNNRARFIDVDFK